jgi:uncharacterized membrane protein
MNMKRSLESRIRGWFPSTPTLPAHNKALIQNTMPRASPLPLALENKYQRWVGILIGLGLGMFVIGVGGAIFTNTTYNTVLGLLNYQGLSTDYYLLRELIQQTAFFLMLAAGGVFMILLGVFGLHSKIARKVTLDKEHNMLGNFLFGFGNGLIILSFRPLFIYFLAPNDATLNHDFLQLKFFAGLLIVGVVLATAGFMSWRRKK